ncbi:M20 family metallopeptidase [Saccharopolyspora pogona]|uniref:M20 family metallopeptidase n=1 Tax=Saccharopolyspora pogona TaxID=333966 RepID=UPI001CC2410F|nr:M20 family metallopeptidase [Saccharopolyspora pogona]
MNTVLTDAQAKGVRAWLAEREEQIVADIADYVRIESPSDDVAALGECLRWLENWLDERLGQPESRQVHAREDAGDVSIRRYSGAGKPLLLLAHYDTVWPLGTIEELPFQRTGDTLTGPGVFDMKAGLVQAVWALCALDALDLPRPAFTLLLNGDEETGSKASSDVIRTEAKRARAALCFEASADGAIKTSRKGVGLFTVTVTGEEGHAGLDPTAGSSAVHEIAHQIIACRALQDMDAGTSVNIGVVRGGTRANVTAGAAGADLDIRVATVAEQERIAAGLAALTPVDPKAKIEVTGEWNRPVFERTGGVAELFALARECAAPLGLDLQEIAVGGASDGNFALDAGTPVLDGIGAVGAGAHARSEHATVSGMIERAALAAGVLAALTR